MYKRKPRLTHECAVCGKTFKSTRANRKYCSTKCYDKSVLEHSRERRRYMTRVREYLLPVFKSSNCLVCRKNIEGSNSAFCSSKCREHLENSISISLEKLIPEMDGLSCSELTAFAIFGFSVARALNISDKVKKGFKDECGELQV